jgi:hypothetical protein
MKRLHQRILALLLPLALLFSVGAQAKAVDGVPYGKAAGAYRVMDAERDPLLPRVRDYEGQFSDVAEDAWYYSYVSAGYEYSLFEGRGDGFDPGAQITVAELLTLSARLHAAYAGEDVPAPEADAAWYMPYVRYLFDRNLLELSIDDYTAPATRAQLAGIFALSLPEECYDAPNDTLVDDAYASGGYITDVDASTPYQAQILWMYRQGLLSGMDESGSYLPDETTTRAETAAVVTRMVDPTLRIALHWVVVPQWSAVGRTLASLVEAPDYAPDAPAFSDAAAVDDAVRQMLASGENTLSLRYPYEVTQSEAQSIANAFMACAKSYCEQMYNSITCQRYLHSGSVLLTFSATACNDEALALYRDETMAKAIEIHDMLWGSGQLNADMSEYEIARVYFRWLCDNCVYDDPGAHDDYSLSHIAYSALLRGTAVCDGYTGAYNLFLKLEGIECRAQANDTHIWTVAVLDGTEYHIDTTWGDQHSFIEWDYFGMSEAQARQAHDWKD